MHLIAKSGKDNLIDAITDSLRKLKGAFSLLIMTKDKMIGVRDAMGMRPLALGKLKNNGYAVEVCYGFESAQQTLLSYLDEK